MIPVDVRNILFICGGAFEGIEKKIAHRLNTTVVGYTASRSRDHYDKDDLLKYIAPQDLRAYGLIPEIIGRLPVLTHLSPLDRKALRAILTEPKNAITKQYVKLFAMDGIGSLPRGLDCCRQGRRGSKLGARGLRAICEAIMMDAMFELPSGDVKEFTVTTEYAAHKLDRVDMKVLKAS